RFSRDWSSDVCSSDLEVAGEQRAIAAAEAPAVDHGDRRLVIPAQATPPAIGLALGLAGGAEAERLVVAEIFLEIHAGRPGAAFRSEERRVGNGREHGV